MDVDIFKVPEPTTQLTISSRCAQEAGRSVIRRVGVTLANSQESNINRKSAAGQELWENPLPNNRKALTLPVEFISQFASQETDNDSRCCPTSATMVLKFWGRDVSLSRLVRQSYDRRHRLYGNWSLTVAAMSSYGLKAWVQKHRSLTELYRILQLGRPVIVSISFEKTCRTGNWAFEKQT